MSDVFISYKRENLAAVGRLVEALRAEGIGIWWDQDIPPNAGWEATIERELAAAKVVIVAWSPAAVASDNVKAEARWARGQGRLLQVFVEACEPPLFFGERQGVDLKAWSGGASEAAFRTVLDAVRSGLESAAVPDAVVGADTPLLLPSKPSIAVMPFANLSGDPEQDYFADGMVVEIVEALSRIRSIFVIASGSSLSFKGKGVAAQDAARQLGVRYMLEGSVRKAGGRVRIGVQLIDAADGAQIWTHRFEDTLEDVFALQDSVALAVAGKIEPTVQQAEIRRASARPTDNLSSYDLYLRALPLQRTFVRADMLEALDLASRAVTLDPDFGPALALAVNCHRIIVLNGWSDDLEGQGRLGLELAHRALRAAGDDAAVLASVAASLDFFESDHGAAVALLERALTLNPGCASAWFWSGLVRVRAGETD
ncbi:MAG TPA: TIR domain-containing protein, partial [Caulobacteraceae bacterium]|nr:TIR domain-containing protein [Caulobacteraceae bacterium]